MIMHRFAEGRALSGTTTLADCGVAARLKGVYE